MAWSLPAAVATGDTLSSTNWNNAVVAAGGGFVAYAQKTADQTGITAAADITSLSVTWTATAGRYYRITLHLAPIRQNTSGGIAVPTISDGSAVTKTQGNVSLAAGEFASICLVDIETGLSGSITRKARISTTAGTIDVLAATAVQGNYLIVEDLGAV